MPRLIYTRIEGEFENADDAVKIVAAAVAAAVGAPAPAAAPAALPERAETPALLSAPDAEPEPERPQQRRKYTKRAKALAVPAEAKQQAKRQSTEPAPRGSLSHMCLEVLKKKPLMSREVFEAVVKQFKYTGEIASIYTCLNTLKTKGVLEPRQDDSLEGGGQRKWCIVNG